VILSGGEICSARTIEKWRSPEGGLGNFKDVYWRPQDSGFDTMINSFDTM
jgi:hypothetical protein